MRQRSHTDREQRLKHARSTLIDALRLVDDGKIDEGVVATAMALALLAPVTDYVHVDGIMKQLNVAAVRRDGWMKRNKDAAPIVEEQR